MLQKFISVIYKHVFNFIPAYDTQNPWIDAFIRLEYEIIELKWNGRIIPYGVSRASEELVNILNSNPDDNYTFLTESIGAEIALITIEKSRFKNVKNIISICPVNKPRIIEDFSMISLKSKSDIFARFSNKFLWPLHFFKSMQGNIENIELENIRHDQFVPNYKIDSNQTLLELIKNKMDNY